MKKEPRLGDRINRAFTFIVIILLAVMIIRFAVKVATTDPDNSPVLFEVEPSDTIPQDSTISVSLVIDIPYYDWDETANALGVHSDSLTMTQFITHMRLDSHADLMAYAKSISLNDQESCGRY